MQYVIICVLFVYVGFHVMYADWSISLSLCTRCVSQERAMIAGWQGCDDHAAHFEARQEDDVRNWQGSFTNSCMLFMRCSEIILGPREGCGEMLDVIACAYRIATCRWYWMFYVLACMNDMAGRIDYNSDTAQECSAICLHWFWASVDVLFIVWLWEQMKSDRRAALAGITER